MKATRSPKPPTAWKGSSGIRRILPDLVITDLMMPGMDGLELMKALQRVTPTPVLMAISGDQAALTQAREITPYTFAKPLPLEQILAAVRNLDLGAEALTRLPLACYV